MQALHEAQSLHSKALSSSPPSNLKEARDSGPEVLWLRRQLADFSQQFIEAQLAADEAVDAQAKLQQKLDDQTTKALAVHGRRRVPFLDQVSSCESKPLASDALLPDSLPYIVIATQHCQRLVTVCIVWYARTPPEH